MTYAIDPELAPWLDLLPDLCCRDNVSLHAVRATVERLGQVQSSYEPAHPMEIRRTTAPGPPGAPDVPVRVYSPARRENLVPGVLYLHGGGYVMCDLDMYETLVLNAVDELGVVVVAAEYRLAPEHPFPAPVEDCYAALTWIAATAAGLGVDPTRLALVGESAGGGLAAAVALLARDRGGPAPCFQLLDVPQLA